MRTVANGPCLERIVTARAAAPVVVGKRLIDRDYGPWAGKRQARVIAEWGSLDAAPGGGAGPVRCAAGARRSRGAGCRSGNRPVLVAQDAINRALLSQLDSQLGPPDRIAQRTASDLVRQPPQPRRSSSRWRRSR